MMQYHKLVPIEHATPLPVMDAAMHSCRTLWLTGEITDDSAAVLSTAIRLLDKQSNDDITVYLMTPGGSVSAGLAIYDTFRTVESDIVTVATGGCASMGAILLAGGTHGKRYATPNAEIMIHQILGSVSGQATDILLHAKNVMQKRAQINGMLAALTGKTTEEIAADTERDHIMTASEALSYGIIDKIGDPFSEA